jgi:hypothetical protein
MDVDSASRRQSFSLRKPSSRLTCDTKPRSRFARLASASRRGTGFTFRGGWNSGVRWCAPVIACIASHSPSSDVSVPLATL